MSTQATPTSRPLSGIAAFDAEHHQLSAEQVATGGHPLMRMSAPTLTTTPEAMVVIGAGRSGAVRCIAKTPDLPSTHPMLHVPVSQNLTAQTLADLFTTTGLVDVVIADRITVRAVVGILAKDTNPKSKWLSKIIGYLARRPAINQCAVLTDALAEKFWCPAGSNADDLRMWGQALGMTASRYGGVRELIAACTDGVPSVVVGRSNLRNSSSDVTSAMLRGNKARVDAFDALGTHEGMWAALQGSDPVLYRRGLRTGSTVALTIADNMSSHLTCSVSTPCKLRTGSTVVAFTTNGTVFQVRLERMDFDPATEQLQVVLGPGTGTKILGSGGLRNQWTMMCQYPVGSDGFCAITAPFMGRSSSRFAGAQRFGPAVAARRPNRSVPLDVALAAAG